MSCHLRNAVLAGLGIAIAAALPVAAEPVQLSHDGRVLNGEVQLAEGRSVRDGVLLLVHGTLAHNRMEIMSALQEMLAERGISTLALTLSLGVSDRKGMYDCAQPHRHGNQQAAAEIGAWVDWAAKQGAVKVGVLGHSRGGAQVAYYAAQAGDRLPAVVQKLVLAAPATFDRTKANEDYRSRYGGDLNAVMDRAAALVAGAKGQELMPDTDFMYCQKTSVAAATFIDYHWGDGRNDAPSLLGRIRRPVLVVVAGGDEIVTDLPQKLEAALKPERYRAVTVDGADHFFQDLYGEDLADAVAAFWAE